MEIPPAQPGALPCPKCGLIFEQSIVAAQGVRMRGHVPGGPLCFPKLPVKKKPISRRRR
jgi:hypothetical protein